MELTGKNSLVGRRVRDMGTGEILTITKHCSSGIIHDDKGYRYDVHLMDDPSESSIEKKGYKLLPEENTVITEISNYSIF